MGLSKFGTRGVYGFKSNGALSTKEDDTNFIGWHLGPGQSAEVTIHGDLNCVINGVNVKAFGTIVYDIQPDDTYVGAERLRPHRWSCSKQGLVFDAPALASDGSLLLTITNNGGHGVVKVKTRGTEGTDDGWAGNGSAGDKAKARRYLKGAHREISVDLNDLSGTLKVLKMPTTAANACSCYSGLYPTSGDMYDLGFTLWGFTVGDCSTVTPPDCSIDTSVIVSCAYDCATAYSGSACKIQACSDYLSVVIGC